MAEVGEILPTIKHPSLWKSRSRVTMATYAAQSKLSSASPLQASFSGGTNYCGSENLRLKTLQKPGMLSVSISGKED